MNFFWGAFFPREHFFLGIICLGAFFGEHLVGSFFWGASGSTPIIQIGLEFFCSKMGLLKFVWLKNGPAQIWLAQKWACSNLGWLKFGSAQIWVGSNLGLLKFGPLKFGRSNLGCSKTAWHHTQFIELQLTQFEWKYIWQIGTSYLGICWESFLLHISK